MADSGNNNKSFLDNKLLSITLGDLTYESAQEGDGPSQTRVTVITGKDGKVFTLNKALVDSISKDLGTLIPEGFSISLEDVTTVSHGTNMAFVGNFKTPLDLRDVPVLKDFIPAGRALKILSTELIHSPQQNGLSNSDISTLNTFIGNINKVLSNDSKGTLDELPNTIKKGFDGNVILEIGTTKFILDSKGHIKPYVEGQTTTAGSQKTTTPPPSKKGVSPIALQGIHFAYENNSFVFKISGSVALGPLIISFQDFTAASPFLPGDIHLDGLGIGMNQPPIFVDGGFTKVDHPSNPNVVSEYNGKLTAGFNKISLLLEGSYASTHSYKSVYAFGVLGMPAMGPPFLYIEDIAAGLGYNRELVIPSPQNVKSYPFIQAIDNPDSLSNANDSIVPIKEDAYFGVAGVRAGSFKMIDNTLLLAFRMNNEVEIDVIGFADMKFPKPKDGEKTEVLAELQLGYSVRFIPDRGVLLVTGTFLPGSYVFNPFVNVSGGFAMLSIFKDQDGGQWNGASAGDFVFTIGGYAKNYALQSYYPRVPRLQMNWTFSPDLFIKAQAYFAITPNAMMAGGFLDANFQAGGDLSIHVHFTCGADFIIYWKPYHYHGEIYANLHVSARLSIDCWLFTIHVGVSFDLGADLQIWGPSFSGHASVHVHVLISFTVGMSFGDSLNAPPPLLQHWSDFSSSFLPDNIISGQITKGVLSSQSYKGYQVVNKKEVALTVKTAVPIYNAPNCSKPYTSEQEIGIKPMVGTNQLKDSKFTISLSGGKSDISHFSITPVFDNVPSALWTSNKDSEDNLIKGVCTGFDIKVIPPVQPDDPYIVKGPIVDPIPGENTASKWGSSFIYPSN